MPRVHLPSVQLHYQIDGDTAAPIVMLSNSLSSALNLWEPQVPALLAAGFRVLRYDTRGHGASAVPAGPYSLAQLGQDAIQLLDALAIDQVHFCGLSLGGMIGQWLGTHHAARLHSLVLCATTAYTGPPATWDERIAAVTNGGMAAVVEGTLSRWFTAASLQGLPLEVARIRAGILSTPVAGYAACGAAIRDMDQRESITTIQVPTQVMVGADDPGTPVSAAEFIHQRIAGSRLVVIPDSQHLFNIEQPAAFNAALTAFLTR